MRFSYLRCAVTTDDLKRAQSYQHRRSGEGIVEKYFDQVASNYVEPLVPNWVSPNHLTLFGCAVHFIGAYVIVSSDAASFAGTVSRGSSWFYITCLMFYALLNASAPRHATNLKAASPLTSLVGYGCGSITMACVSMVICTVMRYGFFGTRMYFTCLLAMLLCFTYFWRSSTIGSFKFGSVAVYEGISGVALLIILNVIFDIELFWGELPFRIPFLLGRTKQIEVGDVLFVVVSITVLCILVDQIRDIREQGITTYAGLPTFKPSRWCLMTCCLSLLNLFLSAYFLYDYIPQFFIINIFTPLLKLTWCCALATMCKCPVPTLDTCLIWPLLFLIWLLVVRFGIYLEFTLFPEYVFNSLAFLSVCDLLYFAISNLFLFCNNGGYPFFAVTPIQITSESSPNSVRVS